ncbi:hypothetical protein, partial [Sphingobacterium spiritivorum]
MNKIYLNINSIALVSCFFLTGCVTTVDMGRTGKYIRRDVNNKMISTGNIGILIHLFDLKSNSELDIGDVKNLPGTVIEATANSKLLVFSKDSIPRSIRIDKPGKSSVIFYPEGSKKNLLI